ncbi:MAG: tyrosine-type recombinase/integrase, partial [Phycisphaerae bacterium]|nr:tyrosine-type recombinase/integrase [Phycisphaerae bacterium]
MDLAQDRLEEFLRGHDFSPHTVKAFRCDLGKFVRWYESANDESFDLRRITVRDVADFRNHVFHVRRQSVATVNRALVSLRRFLGHLEDQGELSANPAGHVKELRRMPSIPKGLTAAQVRRIMREVEIRQDRRAGAIFGLMVHGGLRVSDVVGLALDDVVLGRRSGHAVCRQGKGGKQRTVPLSREARRLLSAYLDERPPVDTDRIFIGERGPLTDEGVRSVCDRYATICGVKFTPHTLRHTFARRYLDQTGNDLTGLAQ